MPHRWSGNAARHSTGITKSGTTTNFSYAGGSQDERTTANGIDAALSALGPDSSDTDIEASGTSYHFAIRDNTGSLIAIINDVSGYSTTRYTIRDTQGSVIALTDGGGNKTDTWTYDPYGIQLTHTGTTYNPYTYNAEHTDTSTGLQHLGARYYNPTDGRYTQQDPSGKETNLYTYTGDNPLNGTGPTGRDAGDVFGGIFAGLAVVALSAATFGVADAIGSSALLVGAALGAGGPPVAALSVASYLSFESD